MFGFGRKINIIELDCSTINSNYTQDLLMYLFTDFPRVDLDLSFPNENTFSYFERSARSDISIIRNLLENWFSNLPESEKHEVKTRFKKSFDSVFYELFLYNFFMKLGYEIVIHPEIPDSTKRPDFLIKKNGLEIYIEAKITKDQSNLQESLYNRTERFYEAIGKIESPYFILGIEKISLKSSKQPATKEIVTAIKEKLQQLDHSKELQKMQTGQYDKLEKLLFENDEIYVSLEFLPVNEDAVGKSRVSLGMTPIETFIGGAEESIRESILTKARRYGKLDKPYLICINALSIKSSSFHDVDNAVWGSLAVSYSTNPMKRDEKLIRIQDGIFYNRGERRIKNVSGIMINRIFPYNIPTSKYRLFKHPFSENELDFEELELPYCFVQGQNIVNNEGNNIGKIFHLGNDWLSG